MCGIALIINGTDDEVKAMGDAISHRGLHNHIYKNGNIKCYFSHLPITTDGPNQPVKAGCITLWLNGYISNWLELCTKYDIDANNDTELLAMFIDKFEMSKVQELNGFFAVVYTKNDNLYSFTDRYGIKQLYIYHEGDKTYICSEVKGIKAATELELDVEGWADWAYSLGVMNDKGTIYKGVRRVACLPFIKPKKINIEYEEAKKYLKELFKQSVRRNKAPDLFSGVFLSGGVDSGIIANYFDPDYCFSMDYIEEQYSELPNIKRNSKGLHYTIICNPELVEYYSTQTMEALDDFKAGSCYTNFALTELASKFCTILYSGAGGDEVFGGYPHRNDKPINDVIKRTSIDGPEYDITHDDYNWRFLKAVLVVEDRMAGYHTMETRYPLLDNDFVNFALSLPDEYLENKRILKDISGLDDEVVNGKKRGFSNPYYDNETWIKFTENYV